MDDDNMSNTTTTSSQRESYFTDEDNMSGLSSGSSKSLDEDESVNNKDEEVIKCKNCNSLFSNKQTLLIHVRTSVKCYNKNNNVTSDSSKICNYCEKKFASKQMRLYHETKCVNKIVSDLTEKHNREMNNLSIEMKKLRDVIKEIKKKENDI